MKVSDKTRRRSRPTRARMRREDTRDAQYKVAVEKCDAMSGAAKDTCVKNAKVRYGKT